MCLIKRATHHDVARSLACRSCGALSGSAAPPQKARVKFSAAGAQLGLLKRSFKRKQADSLLPKRVVQPAENSTQEQLKALIKQRDFYLANRTRLNGVFRRV